MAVASGGVVWRSIRVDVVGEVDLRVKFRSVGVLCGRGLRWLISVGANRAEVEEMATGPASFV